jgi:hypothetical protein
MMEDHDEIVALKAKIETMEMIMKTYLPKPQPPKLRLGKLSKSSIGVSLFFGVLNFIKFMFFE